MGTKIIDYIEYLKTEDGWTARKVHDEGEAVMEHKVTDDEIRAIEAGKRPAWTLIGLPRILVNGRCFKEFGER